METNVYFKNCDCRKVDTPVIMQRSIDPNFWVGECSRCNKIHAEKTPEIFKPKTKKENSVKIRGNSSWQKENGFFNGTKEN